MPPAPSGATISYGPSRVPAESDIGGRFYPGCMMHRVAKREGWQGWDEYAPFDDWENAQTLGRPDVPFWRRVAAACGGPVLELGCGTGRVSLPLARAGVNLVGIDRSAPMLARARTRTQILRSSNPQILKSLRSFRLVRGDIR